MIGKIILEFFFVMFAVTGIISGLVVLLAVVIPYMVNNEKCQNSYNNQCNNGYNNRYNSGYNNRYNNGYNNQYNNGYNRQASGYVPYNSYYKPYKPVTAYNGNNQMPVASAVATPIQSGGIKAVEYDKKIEESKSSVEVDAPISVFESYEELNQQKTADDADIESSPEIIKMGEEYVEEEKERDKIDEFINSYVETEVVEPYIDEDYVPDETLYCKSSEVDAPVVTA